MSDPTKPIPLNDNENDDKEPDAADPTDVPQDPHNPTMEEDTASGGAPER